MANGKLAPLSIPTGGPTPPPEPMASATPGVVPLQIPGFQPQPTPTATPTLAPPPPGAPQIGQGGPPTPGWVGGDYVDPNSPEWLQNTLPGGERGMEATTLGAIPLMGPAIQYLYRYHPKSLATGIEVLGAGTTAGLGGPNPVAAGPLVTVGDFLANRLNMGYGLREYKPIVDHLKEQPGHMMLNTALFTVPWAGKAVPETMKKTFYDAIRNNRLWAMGGASLNKAKEQVKGFTELLQQESMSRLEKAYDLVNQKTDYFRGWLVPGVGKNTAPLTLKSMIAKSEATIKTLDDQVMRTISRADDYIASNPGRATTVSPNLDKVTAFVEAIEEKAPEETARAARRALDNFRKWLNGFRDINSQMSGTGGVPNLAAQQAKKRGEWDAVFEGAWTDASSSHDYLVSEVHKLLGVSLKESIEGTLTGLPILPALEIAGKQARKLLPGEVSLLPKNYSVNLGADIMEKNAIEGAHIEILQPLKAAVKRKEHIPGDVAGGKLTQAYSSENRIAGLAGLATGYLANKAAGMGWDASTFMGALAYILMKGAQSVPGRMTGSLAADMLGRAVGAGGGRLLARISRFPEEAIHNPLFVKYAKEMGVTDVEKLSPGMIKGILAKLLQSGEAGADVQDSPLRGYNSLVGNELTSMPERMTMRQEKTEAIDDVMTQRKMNDVKYKEVRGITMLNRNGRVEGLPDKPPAEAIPTPRGSTSFLERVKSTPTPRPASVQLSGPTEDDTTEYKY